MTKIVDKLPVMADILEKFRVASLTRATESLTADFAALCAEFTTRFANNKWILMGNKDVYYVNDIVGLLPNLANRSCDHCSGYYKYKTDFLNNLKFAGCFDGDLPTYNEAVKCFVNQTKYFRDGSYIMVCGTRLYGLTYKNGSQYWYYNTYHNGAWQHDTNYNEDVWTIPFFRFNGEDSAPATAAQAILYWLEYDLTPKNFKSAQTKNIFAELKKIYAKYKDYLKISDGKILFDEEKIFTAAANGTAFDFIPNVKALIEAKEVKASQKFVDTLRTELLMCDKVRADLDPYDANILVDPNRGHWDLWDYGEGEETAGEIILPEKWTARDPAEDINHGIVAIDFGTKSTVVVYENDNLQSIPLQVGSGNYSKGVKAENYENPTVIEFTDIDSFVAAYKARAGRPKTKWNEVTVSHTAFDNLSGSNSANYYAYLTSLKQWCGSNERLKLKDKHGVIKDLPLFTELLADELNPLEIYAYYLGLYINNMLQERRLFMKYIMSFPVSYEKSVREKMRRSFDRGIKKSLPTALLNNEELMKTFIVQNGASEPAAYAITALQEYNFDPDGDEEFYYAVFDFGGGTTDFDFGVFRESELDRYDYSLIHFGENGDKTLGGENLLKLLAFEVFKANQEKLLDPKKDRPDSDTKVGKIPFTFAADKKDFVGSTALIKDSQEANQNMHDLAEALRPIWEDPDGEAANKILKDGKVEVRLFTDKGGGYNLPGEPLTVTGVDLKKLLRDRIEQGVRNFFIAMKEAFAEASRDETLNIQPLNSVGEISIFLAGNSSKSKLVTELFDEYLGTAAETDELKSVAVRLADGTIVTLKNDPDTGEVIIPEEIAAQDFTFESVDMHSKNKAQEIFGLAPEKMPTFKIYPALGTEAAHELQKKLGVEVNPNDIAAPTGKTGVAFGLLKCRDSGNVKITHVTPNANYASFQFYVGRNKKRKFKPVIEKNTVLGEWYPFIDAGNSFDILYSDLPEAVSGSMDVQKARRVNVTLDECNPKLTVFIRAVNATTIEYQIAADIEDLSDAEKLNGVEPIPIKLA